ncbi:MFS transporter [Thermasporomyces composti]|jgi:MFS family permease|uniref:Putative MFS family arabinose efflux permease n=1 Tax=Thermasporomyces composti TaxID=696763 RepID=A0A3D9V4X5_THECX|nr:MFS transporter [Thermasporomyces composti]REF36798.1 putative MFS family arabinose efflux permease [Thermasporomyces composti]
MPREVPVLAAIAFAVSIGFGVVAPAIPVFAAEFGVGKTAAAAVISAFAFMRFVSAFGGGRLVDRFGERSVLSAGMFFVAGSSILAGLSQNYPQLLVLRGIGGIGSAMFTVSAVSLLFRVSDPAHRGRANGLFQGGFLLGGLAGPVLGGVLTEISARLSFFVYGAALAAAGLIGMLFLSRATVHPRRDRRPRAEDDDRHTTLGEAVRHRAFQAALVTNFGTGWALFGVRASLVPLFVTEAMRVGPIWTGIGFLVGSAVQSLVLMPTGRFVDTVGRRPSMIIGGLVSLVAAVLLAVSPSVPVYLLSMALFGIGGAHLGVAPGAVVADVVRGRGGQVVATFQMAADFGSIVGPLVAGYLADQLSYGAAFGATAGILLLGPLLALWMPETRWSGALAKGTAGAGGSASTAVSDGAESDGQVAGASASDRPASDDTVSGHGAGPATTVWGRTASGRTVPGSAPHSGVSDGPRSGGGLFHRTAPRGGVVSHGGASPSEPGVGGADPRSLPRRARSVFRRSRGELNTHGRGSWPWSYGTGRRRGRRGGASSIYRPPSTSQSTSEHDTCPGP